MKIIDIQVSEELGNNVRIELTNDNCGVSWTYLTKGEDIDHVLLQLKNLVDMLEFWIHREKDGV